MHNLPNYPYTFTDCEANEQRGGLPKIYDLHGTEIAEIHGDDNEQRDNLASLFTAAPDLASALELAISKDMLTGAVRALAVAALMKSKGA